MRILVTGASGFIGRHLIARLSGRHEILALVYRQGAARVEGSSAVVAMDLSRPLDLQCLPPQVDVIVHMAQANASLFPEDANKLFAVNTGATQQLLDYGRRAGMRQFVLASTGDVYGQRRGLAKERDDLQPVSYYAVTKYTAERLAQSYSAYLSPCILRFYHPYGPGQLHRLIPGLAERIKKREAIKLNQESRPYLTPLYIDDVTCAIMRAIDLRHSGTINIAGDQAVNIRELAEATGTALGTPPIFTEANTTSADLSGDNRLMKQVLGDWQLTPLNEGLSRMFTRKEAAS